MTTTGLALTLAAAVLLGCALSLGRLLRGTRPAAWAWLGVATVVAAGLRLVHTGDYPPYLSEDETKSLAQAMVLLKIGAPLQVFDMGEIILPITSSVLFKATLVPLVGPTRWAMRSYSLLCSLLSVPAAFAVGRAFGFRVAPSLALAGFLATLNWAIFHGRVDLGASMVFHQLLLLAALARLVYGRGGWPEAVIGGFALALLLYDYHPGRVLIGMPLLGALLATGRRRLLCLAMPLIAVAAFWPHVVATNHAPFAFYREHAGVGMGGGVLGDFGVFRIVLDNHLWSYVTPANSTAPVLSIRSGSWHPALLVLLALVGSLRTPRLALLLWGGFLATLVPSLLSGSELPSSRRLLATYPFIAIAAAAALDWIEPRRLRNLAVALTVAIAAVQSSAMFFSTETWPEEERNDPETQISAVIESLPDAPAVPVMLTSDFWQHLRPQIEAGRAFETLTPRAWSPPAGGVILGFGPYWKSLRPFLEPLVGPGIRDFGRAFRLDLPPGDWSWLLAHGWTYSVTCDGVVHEARVPALFHEFHGFAEACPEGEIVHRWRARWLGDTTRLRLQHWGVPMVRVESAAAMREFAGKPDETFNVLEWTVAHGEIITVEAKSSGPRFNPQITLFLADAPEPDVLPAWESVAPVANFSCDVADVPG